MLGHPHRPQKQTDRKHSYSALSGLLQTSCRASHSIPDVHPPRSRAGTRADYWLSTHHLPQWRQNRSPQATRDDSATDCPWRVHAPLGGFARSLEPFTCSRRMWTRWRGTCQDNGGGPLWAWWPCFELLREGGAGLRFCTLVGRKTNTIGVWGWSDALPSGSLPVGALGSWWTFICFSWQWRRRAQLDIRERWQFSCTKNDTQRRFLRLSWLLGPILQGCLPFRILQMLLPGWIFQNALRWVLFFCSQAVGSCNLVLFIHHSKMRRWKSVQNSRIGAMPIVQMKQVKRPGKNLLEHRLDHGKNKQHSKGEARQEPRHPPARCPETRQQKTQTPTITIQSSKTEIYQPPTVSCRDTFQWQVTKSNN